MIGMRASEFSSWFGRVLLSSLVLAGCSSDVVVDAGGGSGGSGAGGQAGDGGSVGDGGSGPTLCEQTCELPACASPDCVKYCNAVEKNCLEESNAAVECRTPYFDEVCDAPGDVCMAEAAALSSCLAQHSPTLCSSTGFTGGGSGCGSTGQCLNGQAASIECEQDGDLSYKCRCLVDDVELGTCQDKLEVGCVLQESCCIQFY